MPFATRLRKVGPKKMEPIIRPLECSLEELFNGCVKKFHVTRKRLKVDAAETGVPEYVDETKALTISVKPGWKKGTKVTFAQEGDAAPNVVPADIIFSLSEQPHAVFSREGTNLVFIATITLSEALCGTTIEVPTLDGRKLAVSCPEVVSPGYEKTVPGEGMPLSKTPNIRGNLVIRFHIVFPKYLEDAQKQVLKKTLNQ